MVAKVLPFRSSCPLQIVTYAPANDCCINYEAAWKLCDSTTGDEEWKPFASLSVAFDGVTVSSLQEDIVSTGSLLWRHAATLEHLGEVLQDSPPLHCGEEIPAEIRNLLFAIAIDDFEFERPAVPAVNQRRNRGLSLV